MARTEDFFVLALSGRMTLGLTIFGLLLLLGGLLYVTARGELRGKRTARVPAAMRPAPSDEVLERRSVERYLAVGFVATMIMAIWLPAYWLREPTRLNSEREAFIAQEVAEGEELYMSLCSSCHGEDLTGTPRSVPVNGESRLVAEPPLAYIYSRYEAAGRKDYEIDQIIYDAIARGRPGTVMPTWSLAYGGPLNSAQIENLMLFIEQRQTTFPAPPRKASGEELFEAYCATCHGPNGNGIGGVGPNLQVALDRMSHDALRETLIEGRLNVNRYSMPAWGVLGDEAIEKLVAFVVSIQED